jgi:hypothetical protein
MVLFEHIRFISLSDERIFAPILSVAVGTGSPRSSIVGMQHTYGTLTAVYF